MKLKIIGAILLLIIIAQTVYIFNLRDEIESSELMCADEKNSLENKIQEAENEIQELIIKNEKLNDDNDQLDVKIRQIEEENQQLKDDNSDLKDECQSESKSYYRGGWRLP